jgi:hypothetical protein
MIISLFIFFTSISISIFISAIISATDRQTEKLNLSKVAAEPSDDHPCDATEFRVIVKELVKVEERNAHLSLPSACSTCLPAHFR